MLTYATYSEAGGVGKTTVASNLGQAHSERGREVLLIDLDPQQGSLTYLLDIAAPRDDDQADNIVRHLIDRPKGDFSDLIHTTEFGFDVIPSHGMLENLTNLLNRAEEIASDIGDDFAPNDRLRQVFLDANIPEQYDTVIVDPPATAGPQLYNAVSATRSLVIPVEPTGKGMQSVEGLEDVVQNLEAELEFNVGVLAVVPNGVGRTSDQESYLDRIKELGYHAPIALRERSSLFEGCWDAQCTAFHYVAYHRSSRRDYEIETLDKLRELACHVEEVGTHD